MNALPQTSIVIGFRDWGLERLRLCLDTMEAAFEGHTYEAIVSDYGSRDADAVQEVALSAGARYVFSDTQGQPWSRSRALNTGFNLALGTVLMCTDADMIFSRGSLAHVADLVTTYPNTTALIECRDLPQGWGDAHLRTHGLDWGKFEEVGKFRGRWGMGGLVAVHRETFDRIRGLDERMHTYGAEDLDFGQRTQRAGNRIHWVDDASVRMFHMWHPSADRRSHEDPEFKAIVDQNRKILYDDKSYVRNRQTWLSGDRDHNPLVSVTICTRNRAHLLADSINSVLLQTVQDFEIIVVDDGSDSQDAGEVVASFEDPRIRYFYQEHRGIPAAHNRAIEESKGHFIANLDDDDLMPPWRLESQLQAIRGGVLGSYGAFVNFDDESGELKMFHERSTTVATAYKTGGAPGHSTWLVDTATLRAIRYNESLLSGEDNEIFLRLLRSGVKFVHCGEVAALRRRHHNQITVYDNFEHERVAQNNRYFLRFNAHHTLRAEVEKSGQEQPWIRVRGHEDVPGLVRPFLPDHLAGSRMVVIDDEDITPTDLPRAKVETTRIVDLCSSTITSRTVLRDLTLADLATLRKQGIIADVTVVDEASTEGTPELEPGIDLIACQLFETALADFPSGFGASARFDKSEDALEFAGDSGHAWTIRTNEAESSYAIRELPEPELRSLRAAWPQPRSGSSGDISIIGQDLSTWLNKVAVGGAQ